MENFLRKAQPWLIALLIGVVLWIGAYLVVRVKFGQPAASTMIIDTGELTRINSKPIYLSEPWRSFAQKCFRPLTKMDRFIMDETIFFIDPTRSGRFFGPLDYQF